MIRNGLGRPHLHSTDPIPVISGVTSRIMSNSISSRAPRLDHVSAGAT